MVRWCGPFFGIGDSRASITITQIPVGGFEGPRATIRFIDDDMPPSVTPIPEDEVTPALPTSQNGQTLAPKRPLIRHSAEPPEKKVPISDIIDETQTNYSQRKEGILMPKVIDTATATKDINIELFKKDPRSYKLIKKALTENDFLNNVLNKEKLDTVIQAMKMEEFPMNSYIIREGETGSHFYVTAEGAVEVIQGGKHVAELGIGVAFGELAILYKAKRFASVKATTNAKLWSLERDVFKKIMIKSGKQEQEDNIRFLSSVPALNGILETDLIKISSFLKREFFVTGTMIVRQGEEGDKFYIIRGGVAVVTKRPPNGGPDQLIKDLTRGDYFGEQALLYNDKRLATVTAKAPGVECLTLERGPFTEFLGNIAELKEKQYAPVKPLPEKLKPQGPSEFAHIKLSDLEILGTLGVGAFGRVELVQYQKDKNLTFALKCLKKIDVVTQQQQEHVYNEKSIMYECKSPFICKLFNTYKDSKYLYFLMEPILGGDVWTILQKKKFFEEKTARFMTACVVEAFEHLHSQGIVYRDLKPENLMLDRKGYVKLVDFGYAKYLANDMRTYTFAGTPEYVAPEIILGNGHDRAVDYWALGILVHELLIGRPPFRGTNHVKTYNLIIRGIDTIEFNSKIPKAAQMLIKKLCRSLPTERLGYLKNGVKDIKNHKFFLGFDWNNLREGKMAAPLIRPINHNKDLSNFDKYEKEKLPQDESSGFDHDF